MSVAPNLSVAGIDEAGRGALAGPVVAGACILSMEVFQRRHRTPRWSPFQKRQAAECFIADSKLLTPEEREDSYEWIIEHCAYGVGIVDVEFIEKRGILAATNRAMLLALEDLCTRATPKTLLIDGRDKFTFPIPHRSIIAGDRSQPCIAAGSILAKVMRDRLMREYGKKNPLYGFEGHKGYGSKEHIASIRCHGPCPLHRLSFLSRILAPEQLHLV